MMNKRQTYGLSVDFFIKKMYPSDLFQLLQESHGTKKGDVSHSSSSNFKSFQGFLARLSIKLTMFLRGFSFL
jgi:hypothetical protein